MGHFPMSWATGKPAEIPNLSALQDGAGSVSAWRNPAVSRRQSRADTMEHQIIMKRKAENSHISQAPGGNLPLRRKGNEPTAVIAAVGFVVSAFPVQYRYAKSRGIHCYVRTNGLTGYQIQGYAQHLKLEEKSEATLEKYLRDIRAFAAWANGQKISKELTAEWKNHLVEQHYAPTSINAMLSALNSLLEFLGLNDCRVKFLKVQRRLFRDADRELTKDD